MRIGLFICSVIALASFVSCSSGNREAYLTQADSLGVHLNHIREVVQSIDSSDLDTKMKTVDEAGRWVLENIHDTLDRDFGLVLGDYLRGKKKMGHTMDNYRKVRKELTFSENQLAALRKDAANGVFSDEDATLHFDSESNAIARLNEAADNLESSYNSINKEFDKLNPQVLIFVDSVKSVIYSSTPVAKKKK